MRRAAVSVAANIAEGFKRRGSKNKLMFYNMSQTSLEEVRYYLILVHDLGYARNLEGLTKAGKEVARLLQGLMNAVRNYS
jgi:four helix bundle protein